MRYLSFLALALVLTSCGEEGSRPEVITKLRGIGAVSTPLVSLPSVAGEAPKTVEVAVTLAMPLSEVASITTFEDIPNGYAVNLPAETITIIPESVTYQALSGFQLLRFSATLPVPTVETLVPLGGKAQVRYGFLVTSGDEEEKLVGSFLVYPEGSPELGWTNPEVTLDSLTDGQELAPNAKVDLRSTIVDPNDEGLKIGWFVSGGEVQNRRARNTVWKTPDPGVHTVILTAHGRKSRGFALEIRNVVTE